MSEVFPQRNLPGGAEDWGRAIENRIVTAESRILQTGQVSNNEGRFTGGQLAVFSRQIDEQVARTTMVQRPANLSATGNATVEPFPRATSTITFPNPGGSRVARVEAYVRHVSSAHATVYAYLSYAGNIVSKLTWLDDSDGVFSLSAVAWLGVGLGTVVLPESGVVSFSLTLIRVGFTATVTTETLTDIEVYLTPFQRTM